MSEPEAEQSLNDRVQGICNEIRAETKKLEDRILAAVVAWERENGQLAVHGIEVYRADTTTLGSGHRTSEVVGVGVRTSVWALLNPGK